MSTKPRKTTTILEDAPTKTYLHLFSWVIATKPDETVYQPRLLGVVPPPGKTKPETSFDEMELRALVYAKSVRALKSPNYVPLPHLKQRAGSVSNR